MHNPTGNNFRYRSRWLTALTLLLMVGLVTIQHFSVDNPAYQVKKASAVFASIDRSMQAKMDEIVAAPTGSIRALEQSDFTLLLFVDDCLAQWSDNQPAFQSLIPSAVLSGSVVTLPNGRYWVRMVRSENRTAIGLLLINHTFPFVNHYLKNILNPAFGFPEGVEVSNDGIDFNSTDGKLLARLDIQESNSSNWILAGWLFAIALLFFQGILFTAGTESAKRRAVFAFSVVVIRLLMILFHVPDVLYASSLFSPLRYASNYFFNSPGDLFLNALAVVLLACSFPAVKFNVLKRKSRLMGIAFSASAFLLIIHFLIKGTVLNGKISYDVSDLSSIDSYTLIVVIGIALYLLSGIILLYRMYGSTPFEGNTGKLMVTLFCAVFVSSLSIFFFNSGKELENRKQFLRKMALERDQIAEFLFEQVASRITCDSGIAELMTHPIRQNDLVENRIRSVYLGDYFSRFDADIRYCTVAEMQLDPAILNRNSFLNLSDQPTEQKDSSLLSRLILSPPEAGKMCYAALLPVIQKHKDTVGFISIKLSARILQTGQGFPELLVSGTLHEHRSPDKWSFARYQNGALVYEYGFYPYAFSDSIYNVNTTSEFSHNSENGLEHLVFRPNKDTLLVLTAAAATPFSFFTLFSWLLMIYSLLLVIVVLFNRLIYASGNTFALSRRIRFTVVALVAFSFLAIGTGTVYFIFKKYDSDQHRTIGEQLNGIWILLGDEAGLGTPLSEINPAWLQTGLDKIKGSTNIDYSLFNENGKLFYTTQPRLYDQGIISDYMNPQALSELQRTNNSQYIHREAVGSLHYLAAYAPFISTERKITGFLHLPYFEKQNERSREVSGLLSALLNIYVLLFALTLFVTAFISSRITKPLALIQEKLAGIRLGKRSEPIVYAGQDEIGLLVQEYNRMVQELADSAEKLARSERESAWREMARQVAHEIKNPLTPMRLSIQHLLRAWNDQSTDRELMLKRVTQTLIEQIDSLSYIATEFSNFAQLPPALPQRMDLVDAVRRTVSLFSESYPDWIRMDVPDKPCIVMADKEQLGRIFSNLLKNAIQAIPDDRKGAIIVNVTTEDKTVRVDIKDNGEGIAEEIKSKIFVPNFTTKSGGTGLGLAMVKNLIEQAHGEVSFSSREGLGTTFTVRWPLAV